MTGTPSGWSKYRRRSMDIADAARMSKRFCAGAPLAAFGQPASRLGAFGAFAGRESIRSGWRVPYFGVLPALRPRDFHWLAPCMLV